MIAGRPGPRSFSTSRLLSRRLVASPLQSLRSRESELRGLPRDVPARRTHTRHRTHSVDSVDSETTDIQGHCRCALTPARTRQRTRHLPRRHCKSKRVPHERGVPNAGPGSAGGAVMGCQAALRGPLRVCRVCANHRVRTCIGGNLLSLVLPLAVLKGRVTRAPFQKKAWSRRSVVI